MAPLTGLDSSSNMMFINSNYRIASNEAPEKAPISENLQFRDIRH